MESASLMEIVVLAMIGKEVSNCHLHKTTIGVEIWCLLCIEKYGSKFVCHTVL